MAHQLTLLFNCLVTLLSQSASYSSACAPYGYDDLFSMSRDDLFNCSYAELMQELSDYANTTVTLDRSPGSAFYDIIEVRTRDPSMDNCACCLT